MIDMELINAATRAKVARDRLTYAKSRNASNAELAPLIKEESDASVNHAFLLQRRMLQLRKAS